MRYLPAVALLLCFGCKTSAATKAQADGAEADDAAVVDLSSKDESLEDLSGSEPVTHDAGEFRNEAVFEEDLVDAGPGDEPHAEATELTPETPDEFLELLEEPEAIPDSPEEAVALQDGPKEPVGVQDGTDGDEGGAGAPDVPPDNPMLRVSWTDPTTGLVWQDPPATDPMPLAAAEDYCDQLVLDGADDWRLPTISELRTLIRGCPDTEPTGPCGVSDECNATQCGEGCDSCFAMVGPGSDGCYWDEALQGLCSRYWSASVAEDDPTVAWSVLFVTAEVGAEPVLDPLFVRCVR